MQILAIISLICCPLLLLYHERLGAFVQKKSVIPELIRIIAQIYLAGVTVLFFISAIGLAFGSKKEEFRVFFAVGLVALLTVIATTIETHRQR